MNDRRWLTINDEKNYQEKNHDKLKKTHFKTKLLKLNSMVKKHFTIKKCQERKKMLRILELILIIID